MPDDVAGYVLRLPSTYHPGAVEPDLDALVFAHPVAGDPLGHRLMYERLRAALKAAASTRPNCQRQRGTERD